MSNITREQFLFDVWGEEPGTVYFASKTEEKKFLVSKPLVWPEHKELLNGAITQSNVNWDTYYTPGIFKAGTTTKEKKNGWRAKSLWLDIDGYKEGMSGPDTVLAMIAEMSWFPMPTYQLRTSDESSAHFYWILEDYQPASVINDLNRRLAYYFGGDKACWDISHVMRPPETHNHKPEKKVDGISPPVYVHRYTGEKHLPDLFNKLPPVKEQMKEILGAEYTQGTLPTIQEVLDKYPFDKERIDALNRTKQSFWDADKKDYIGRGNAMMFLAYFGAEIGMSDEALYIMLVDIDSRWGKFENRTEQQRKTYLVDMIAKVRSKYPSSTFVVEVAAKEPVVKPVYTLKEFMASDFKFNWIYKDVISEESINFISARPGTGKSRFIIQLARSLALGRDFLNWKLVGNRPRKVMIFSLEMGPATLKKFMGSMTAESTAEEIDLMDENFLIIPAGEPLAIATPEGEQFFNMVLKDHEPEIVIIDAMGSLDFEELSEKTSKKIMNTLKKYLNSHGITFYMVHHNKKSDAASINKPPTLNDFYGNTYAATDAASIMALWKNPASSIEHTELHTLKSRLGVEPKPVVLDSYSNFMFSVATGEEATVAKPARDTTSSNAKTSEPAAAPASAFGFNFGS